MSLSAADSERLEMMQKDPVVKHKEQDHHHSSLVEASPVARKGQSCLMKGQASLC